MALITSPTSVLSLSPEKDEELVKAPAILSFQVRVNHFFGGGLDKRLHARGHTAHVGRTAEDDRIGRVQFVEADGSFFRSVELGGDRGHALRAAKHGVGLKFGVPVGRVINDGDFTHGARLAN
jgi:hypothetical protein